MHILVYLVSFFSPSICNVNIRFHTQIKNKLLGDVRAYSHLHLWSFVVKGQHMQCLSPGYLQLQTAPPHCFRKNYGFIDLYQFCLNLIKLQEVSASDGKWLGFLFRKPINLLPVRVVGREVPFSLS